MSVNLSCEGGVLTLTVGDKVAKCILPKGERGPTGRDGISMKGDKGDQGLPGVPGRDSAVPGAKGDKGECGVQGIQGKTPLLSVGEVRVAHHGEQPGVHITGMADAPTLNFVLPVGPCGLPGKDGKNGKDGSHEYINSFSIGHSPLFGEEWKSSYLIADGMSILPEMKPTDLGSWFHVKTFTDFLMTGCAEHEVKITKGESAKMVCIFVGGKCVFTRF
jgi:hypothetical protein